MATALRQLVVLVCLLIAMVMGFQRGRARFEQRVEAAGRMQMPEISPTTLSPGVTEASLPQPRVDQPESAERARVRVLAGLAKSLSPNLFVKAEKLHLLSLRGGRSFVVIVTEKGDDYIRCQLPDGLTLRFVSSQVATLEPYALSAWRDHVSGLIAAEQEADDGGPLSAYRIAQLLLENGYADEAQPYLEKVIARDTTGFVCQALTGEGVEESVRVLFGEDSQDGDNKALAQRVKEALDLYRASFRTDNPNASLKQAVAILSLTLSNLQGDPRTEKDPSTAEYVRQIQYLMASCYRRMRLAAGESTDSQR